MSLEYDISGLIEEMNLVEGMASAKKKYVDSGQMSQQMLSRFAKLDPTEQKKYVEWMARMFVQGYRRGPRGFDMIKQFDDLVQRNKIQQKDINQYANPTEVLDAIHAAELRIGEELRAKKEKEVRKALIATNGSVDNAYKFVNKKYYTKQDDGSYVADKDNPGYVSKELVQRVRKQMEAEEAGQQWKNFSIDDEIFDHLKKEDIVFDNKYVTIVEPKSKASAQFYGRNMWYDASGSHGRTSFWCVAYSGEHEGCYWDQYAYYDTAFVEGDETKTSRKDYYHRFYIILPKDISMVDKKEHAKLIVQAKENGSREVWDTDDRTMSDDEIDKVFKMWEIPWEGRRT